MIRLSQARNKALLAIHGWSGALLGLLLYAVILTGTVSVFSHEIGDWSAPLEQAPQHALPHRIDAALRNAAQQIDPKYLESLFFFSDIGGRVRAFFHADEKDASGRPVDRGVGLRIHPQTLQVLERYEGESDAIKAQEQHGALAEFFVDLHVRLHLPNPWGLLLTGVLGLAMMVAAMTGFIVHRHLIRELFTLRRRRDALLTARDTHVVAGTWNLLFAFVLAFTGSFFSFGTAFGVPAIAMVAFGGDQERLIDTVVGGKRAEDARPAAFANLDDMLADARRRSGSEIGFVSVAHWGRADATVTMTPLPPAGRFAARNYSYDGASGAFLHEKPTLGLQPSLGSDLFDLMGPLHFGSFGGLLSKAVWFALGFAATYVALTGMLLWTARRAGDSRAWRRYETTVYWMGYGLPLALAWAPLGYFGAMALGADTHAGTNTAFLAAVAVATVLCGVLRERLALRRVLLALTGLALLLTPLLRGLAGGPGWGLAFDAGLRAVIALDSALLIGGVWCLRGARPSRTTQQFDGPRASPA